MEKTANLSTKDTLLKSGAILIAEKGYNGVSVREICTHANTSINMIHHYFKSKEGLLKAIVQQFGLNVFAVPMRLLDKSPKSKEEFQSRIEMLFESTLDAYLQERVLLMVILREQPNPPALVEYMERFSKFIEQAKEKGFVRSELDSEMVTGFLLDRILNQVQFAPWLKKIYGFDLHGDPEYKERWCASNLDLFLYGMLT